MTVAPPLGRWGRGNLGGKCPQEETEGRAAPADWLEARPVPRQGGLIALRNVSAALYCDNQSDPGLGFVCPIPRLFGEPRAPRKNRITTQMI